MKINDFSSIIWYMIYSIHYKYSMNNYIPQTIIEKVEALKDERNYDEALEIINNLLIKDPNNEEALLQIADIQYRKWDIKKASKAIDFLSSKKKNDPMCLYIQGLLEMEKNNWKEAKDILKKSMELTQWDNPEIIRCYGLSEYWYGNREKWMKYIKDAFYISKNDAEVIFNLIEIYIMEQMYEKAQEMISYYHKNHKDLNIIDKTIEFYDQKISLFQEFLKIQKNFKQ